ncbi:MAG: hypothetical protein AAFW84_35900 [Cyanobacteria bacterium J06635_15]
MVPGCAIAPPSDRNAESDERLVEASAPALMILLVGLLPVIALSRQIARSQHQKKALPLEAPAPQE